MTPHPRSPRGRLAVLAGCLALAVGMFASSFAAVGQEPRSQAQGLQAQGLQAQALPPPKDTIFARKILMGAIDMNMDEIETMLAPGGMVEAADAIEHADTI